MFCHRQNEITRIRRQIQGFPLVIIRRLILHVWNKMQVRVRKPWFDVIVPREWNGATILLIMPFYVEEWEKKE